MSEGITSELVNGGESDITQLTRSAEEFRNSLERGIETTSPEKKLIFIRKHAEVNNLLMVLINTNRPSLERVREIRTRLEKLILEQEYLGKHKLTPYPPSLKAVKDN